MLDTVVTTETPEGIVLELRPAGLAVRYYAFLIDWCIRLAVMIAVGIVAPQFGGVGLALWFILLFAIEWFYPVLFELSRSGATPGKRVFGLKVVMESGLPVTAAASMTRNLLRVADFLPFAYAFGVMSLLVRPDGKRLGDLAAGTLVVHERRREREPVLDDVDPLPPQRPLAPREQAALIALAARASTLTPERLNELAALAAPVSGDPRQASDELTERVLGVAQWALGRR